MTRAKALRLPRLGIAAVAAAVRCGHARGGGAREARWSAVTRIGTGEAAESASSRRALTAASGSASNLAHLLLPI